ncbi:hypothetical protein HK104_004657 [Borealophlyctis nickersoniae]|nr:hypothetical protein HK104_004657 [Borealophlyctis nickersoniae]
MTKNQQQRNPPNPGSAPPAAVVPRASDANAGSHSDDKDKTFMRDLYAVYLTWPDHLRTKLQADGTEIIEAQNEAMSAKMLRDFLGYVKDCHENGDDPQVEEMPSVWHYAFRSSPATRCFLTE